ncbi:MAG: DUF2029 domain-containing protein [Myxococcales bacterium]|nr:DUF2029 domain-containing protein [Myxococcales bacterium]
MSTSLTELAAVVASSWRGAGPRLALTFAVALGVGLLVPALSPRARRVAALALGLLGLAWGLARATSLAWLADDAFISLRYAEHFAHGDGLVFNLGEKVEGYTNFLLVVLLGLARFAGASLPSVALAIDLLSFMALVGLAEALVRTVRPEEPGGGPWAGLAVAVARPFHLFATSGLETELALALVAGGVWAWRRGRPWAASVLLGLGALTRPDHLLLAGAVWLVAAATTRGPWRERVERLVPLVVPALALFTTWWLWRWWYYADFFPNTFHTKSGGGAYWSQGLVYLTHALLASGAVVLLPWVVAAPVLVRQDSSARPLVWLFFAVAATHGLYVTRVGGDFMEYRFLLPSLYFALVAWGASLRSLGRPARWAPRLVAVGAAAVGLAFVALDTRPIGPMEKRWYLAAEETFWPVERLWPLTINHEGAKEGRHLRQAFEGTGVAPRVALGSIGASGFYSGLPITDALGLTSPRIGRKPVGQRGRPGHEKFATPEEMADDGAVFSQAPVWPGTAETLRLTIDGRAFWLIHHDAALERLARSRGWRYPDFDALVDAAAASAPTPQALAAERSLYERVLRGTPGAEERLARLGLKAVVARLGEVPHDPALLAQRVRQADGFAQAGAADALRARVAWRFDFEGDERPTVVEGALWPPAAVTMPNQQPVEGFQGQRLLNTYHDGDATKGRVEWALPALPRGGWVSLLVGGGRACTQKYVALQDGDREVARWCGEDSERLRSVSASLEGLAAPRLVVVDDEAGGWGHLLVDDLLVLRP